MRFRLEPAPPRHVVTVRVSVVGADPEQQRRLRLLTDDTVEVAIDAIGEALGLPADPAQRLITPILRQYGRPDLKAELGFGRRTLDARKYPLFDALSEVGALARIHRAGQVVDIEVESISTPDPDADYPSVDAAPEPAGDLSSTTTDRGPTE